MGLIYIATLRLNTKQAYIGQTVLSLKERRRQHERNRQVWSLSECNFDRILLNYGILNWDWEILDSNVEDGELHRIEKEFIEIYQKKGYDLFNINHNTKLNPRIDANKRANKKLTATINGRKTWDKENRNAHKARFITGKIKPVFNITLQRKYDSITDLRDIEKISIKTIETLCEEGKPNEKTGFQYAYLDENEKPKLKEGHKQKYPILNKIEIQDIKTKESQQIDIFKAALIIKCRKSALTCMKILNLGGKKDIISCNGYIIFALDDNGNRIETESHKRRLERELLNKENLSIWKWNLNESKWIFEQTVLGANNVSLFLQDKIGGDQQSSYYINKISEILTGKRKHIKGYCITTNTDQPKFKPLIKKNKVIYLNSDGNIKIFDSVMTAGMELGIEPRSITACCRGKINKAVGKRFAWADEKGEPIYTQKHKDYSNNKTGLGKSVYWEEGSKSFNSISELRRHLLSLLDKGDERVVFVPKADKLSKIAKGDLPGEFKDGNIVFKLTLKMIE